MRILFNKKISIMYGKGERFKLKGSTCKISIEGTNTCNTLRSPVVFNELIVVKLERDLKHSGHVYFE